MLRAPLCSGFELLYQPWGGLEEDSKAQMTWLVKYERLFRQGGVKYDQSPSGWPRAALLPSLLEPQSW